MVKEVGEKPEEEEQEQGSGGRATSGNRRAECVWHATFEGVGVGEHSEVG